MVKIATLCLIVAGFYGAATLLLFVEQRSFIYPAPQSREDIRQVSPELQPIKLQTSDGLKLTGLYRPARNGRSTLVFFHGNGDNLRGGFSATDQLARQGYGVLLPEYRGYGANPGSPTEAGLYRDGAAALEWLAQSHVPANQLILIGNSLGSGVATELASKHKVAGLILISGFASLTEVAAEHFPYFPTRLLVRDRYDNRTKLPQVEAPVLILHGSDDQLVSTRHAQELAKANSRARLVIVHNAGHELAYLPQSQATIMQWLAEQR